jgi:choline dehydrogenase-like flavoprotein
LQKSGIEAAGSNLFIDILVNTYGVTDDFNLLHEPQMALVDLEFHAQRGFLLSTCINHSREVRLIELGLGGAALPANRLVGMMTKITDEPSGRVFANGSVSKTVTRADRQKLDEGTRISTEILVKAGAKPDSIRYSVPQGAHPGGTAAIGKVVDSRLMTQIQNLYVCDASVLPQAPGLPPILTLVALGKWLAKDLAK